MEVYKHDYSGMCAPAKGCTTMNQSFSVGIFQWVPRKWRKSKCKHTHESSSKGLKKSPVKFRISGPISDPALVYMEAKRICTEMDNGIFPKTKSMRV